MISSLKDLEQYRSAPNLDILEHSKLMAELKKYVDNADWFTIGIMANSIKEAIDALRESEKMFNWPPMNIVEKPSNEGPVFLKANQRTKDVYIRIEYGLGEGILITCQQDNNNNDTTTLGPFPLGFFK